MYETRDHIKSWIERLKKDISEIDVDSPDYNFNQAFESVTKLELYLVKLESGEYEQREFEEA